MTPITDFPGYFVTLKGRVHSDLKPGARPKSALDQPHRGRRRVLKPNLSGHYPTVALRRDGKTFTRYIHHLVLETFVGPCPPGMECLHQDGNPLNNALDNLRWGTSKENSADTIRHGRQTRGERIPQHRLKASDIPTIFDLRKQGLGHGEIARRFGVCRTTISYVLSRKTWRSLDTLTLIA